MPNSLSPYVCSTYYTHVCKYDCSLPANSVIVSVLTVIVVVDDDDSTSVGPILGGVLGGLFVTVVVFVALVIIIYW